MPAYNPPIGTAPSKSNTGYKAVFGVDPANLSPPSINYFAELKRYKITFGDRPEVDQTTLQSPNYTEEFLPGPTKPGVIEFSGNAIGDTTQLSLDALLGEQNACPFEIQAAMQGGTKTLIITGMGYLASHDLGDFEIGKITPFSAKFQMTGPYVRTVT